MPTKTNAAPESAIERGGKRKPEPLTDYGYIIVDTQGPWFQYQTLASTQRGAWRRIESGHQTRAELKRMGFRCVRVQLMEVMK